MQTGLFFAILPVFWIISSILVQTVPDKVDKRAVIIISSLFASLAFLCCGPSIIPHFPDSLLVMIIGQALFGITYAFIMVPSLPEMLDASLEYFPQHEHDINNMCPGMFSTAHALG